MSLLFRDLSGLPAPMLVKAGDLIALKPGRPRELPSASEVVEAVEVIMADRAAKQAAAQRQEAQERGQPMPIAGDKAAAYHRANVLALSKGFRVMQTDDGELFRLGDPGERRGIRPDGSAIVPWWHDKTGDDDTVPVGWYVKQADAATLAACYRQYDAKFHMRGASIECGAA